MYIFDPIWRNLPTSSDYAIEEQRVSSTSIVIFIYDEYIQQRFCLKMWQRREDVLLDTGSLEKRVKYLVDGLSFNRRFAPGVCLGIAPVEVNRKTVHLGSLIKYPKEHKLLLDKEYALVMRCLKEEWRLDLQLYPDGLGDPSGMMFLAKEVARMHKRLAMSPKNRGYSNDISAKLVFNQNLFKKALDQSSLHHENVEIYRSIGDTMSRACREYTEYFDQRANAGYIKRCHGDLKASNLWVCPMPLHLAESKKYISRLLALDCVDFNHPEFYHIDTLSDVAMLAVDIEMHLAHWLDKDGNNPLGEDLAQLFLRTYLHEAQEKSDIVWPLLEYYTTEKSIVRYMNSIDDNELMMSKQYLHIVQINTQRLENRLQFLAK